MNLAMQVAPLPPDEPERLAALAAMHVMDSGPDSRFDSFVRLAANLYNVPIALVSLVDANRQWFKASHGLDVRQTPRDYAFCSHAILDPDEVMVVEDAATDARFAGNPLVTNDPAIQFYAGATVRSPSGRPLGTLCVIDRAPRTMDADDRLRLQQLAAGVSALLDLHRHAVELQRAATHDKLTGLANRALFDHRLELAVADALLGRPCTLLLLDLDRFKRVNDMLGHMAGDQLLQAVAGRLRGAVRGADLVARFGGDEFAILMAEPADEAATAALVDRILAAFEAPVLLDGEKVWTQTSIGVAHCPLDAQGAGDLLRAADQALYQAKRTGSGRAALAGERRAAPAPRTPGQELEADLRAALQAGDVTIAWQPFVSTRTGVVAGFEALTRWLRPGHGAVEPAVLIPFAEATALIAPLDSWMLQEACRQAALWPNAAQVSVNLSAHWFAGAEVAAANLVALVAETLRDTGLAPGRLCLEITERTLISAKDVARDQLDALHALGVQVALDDFGTGFSSLGYLRDLPFDIIKLDQSFVGVLGSDARADQVAGAILDLGHRLGMKVCAEGVESPAQLEYLRAHGCELAQGYLIGRPCAVPAFGVVQAAAA